MSDPAELILKKFLGTLNPDQLLFVQQEIIHLMNRENLAALSWEKAEKFGKLTAVKFIKVTTGWGLKESKDYIDTLYVHAQMGVDWTNLQMTKNE